MKKIWQLIKKNPYPAWGIALLVIVVVLIIISYLQ
jgi:hypothetical protein